MANVPQHLPLLRVTFWWKQNLKSGSAHIYGCLAPAAVQRAGGQEVALVSLIPLFSA